MDKSPDEIYLPFSPDGFLLPKYELERPKGHHLVYRLVSPPIILLVKQISPATESRGPVFRDQKNQRINGCYRCGCPLSAHVPIDQGAPCPEDKKTDLVMRCNLCGTFEEIPAWANMPAHGMFALPIHYGRDSTDMKPEPGTPMMWAQHLREAGVCPGSEGLARVTPVTWCDECGAPVPESAEPVDHPWHKESCSLHPTANAVCAT